MTTTTKLIQLLFRILKVKEVRTAYDADDGELTAEQLTEIHKAVPQGQTKSVNSSLF